MLMIIVCGHYGCGGVKAALSGDNHGLINNWLEHIRTVKRLHEGAFEGLACEEEIEDLLCELNVVEQVNNVCTSTIVRGAWRHGNDLRVEGWVYGIEDGGLKSLCSRTWHG